jgi:hypothetical protein
MTQANRMRFKIKGGCLITLIYMMPTKIQSRRIKNSGKIALIPQFLTDLSHHSPKMDEFFKGRESALFFDYIDT